MHKFLRAIGFSHITKEQLQHIFADIISAPRFRRLHLIRRAMNLQNSQRSMEIFLESLSGVCIMRMIPLRWNITIRIYVERTYPQ